MAHCPPRVVSGCVHVQVHVQARKCRQFVTATTRNWHPHTHTPIVRGSDENPMINTVAFYMVIVSHITIPACVSVALPSAHMMLRISH